MGQSAARFLSVPNASCRKADDFRHLRECMPGSPLLAPGNTCFLAGFRLATYRTALHLIKVLR
jgi:hypothetical protein